MLTNCSTSHTFLECDPSTLADTLYPVVDARDMSGMTDVDASLLYFCSLVAKQNKVALTGECADEIFGGYPWFYRKELMERDGFPWSADISASTYSGLGARVPFADHRIMEYVFNVPWEMKYQNGVEKTLLRDACAVLLPKELLHRKKSPYPKTYHPGCEKLLAERLTAIINDPNAPIAPLVDKKRALTFIQTPGELGKPWFGQLMAGPQLMAYFIQLNYWMEKYHLSV